MELYATGAVRFKNGSNLRTLGGAPSEVLFQITGDEDVKLDGDGVFNGVIYAPSARVSVDSGLSVSGALVGRELVFAKDSRLSFDADLDRIAEDSVLPRVLSWRIVNLSAPAESSTGDPFRRLQLTPDQLPRPAAAHADQMLDLTYVDKAGATRTYSGMESGFDWKEVQKVSVIQRDGELLDGPAAGSDIGGGPQTDVLRDLGLDPNADLDSKDIKDALKDMYPNSTRTLLKVIALAPLIDSGDLKTVLKDNEKELEKKGGGLNDSVLLAACMAGELSLESKDLKDVLKEACPLSAKVQDAVLQRPDPWDSKDLKDVLKEACPLDPSIVALLENGARPELAPNDRQDILDEHAKKLAEQAKEEVEE